MEVGSEHSSPRQKGKDERFLEFIREYLDTELTKLEEFSYSPSDVFAVYGDVFSRLIGHMTHTKTVLSRVRFEFDRCVELLKAAPKESAFLTGHLKARAARAATIKNYQTRISDLDEKIRVIQDDNRRIRDELSELQEKRGKEHQRLKFERENAASSQELTDTDLAPGLTLDQAIDLKQLTAKSHELDSLISHLTELQQSSYQLRTTKDKTKANLMEKIAAVDEMKKTILETRARKMKLRLAAEAAEAFIMAPPVGMTIGEYVIAAMKGQKSALQVPSTVNIDQMDILNDLSADREGSAAIIHDEKEAEALMEYLQQFTLLFDSGKYAEAATCAANSPKGILRNFETLTKFKQVSRRRPSIDFPTSASSIGGRDAKDADEDPGPSPILLFCQSLLVAVGIGTSKLDPRMSLECVKVALEEERLELVNHWMAQDKLTLSADLGQLLLDYALGTGGSFAAPLELVALAQHVYYSVADYRHAAATILMQGQTRSFVNLVRSHGSHFSVFDFRYFFASVLRISEALSQLPTTSAAQQRLFLANAAYMLAAPGNGLPNFKTRPHYEGSTSTSSSEQAERKPEDFETALSDGPFSPENPNRSELHPELIINVTPAGERRDENVTREGGPLTLTEVTTELWRAGRADAVLKLLLKYEREFGTDAISDFLRETNEIVDGGEVKGGNESQGRNTELEAEVDWKAVAKAIRGFGYTKIAEIVETAKESDRTQPDE